MKRDFLKNLGVDDSLIDQILDENSRDIGREKQKTDSARSDLAAANEKISNMENELASSKKSNGDLADIQKQLNDLQAKYDADIADRDNKLADRDYADAITKAMMGAGLKFSSKSAESAFVASLKDKKLEIKDGKLEGFDDFIKEQKEADPDAFAPEKAPPKIVSPLGNNSAPPKQVSRAAQIAADYNKNHYGDAKKE